MALSVNPSRVLFRPIFGAVNSCVRFASGCEKKGPSRCPKVLTKFPCGKPNLQAPPKKKRKMVKAQSMWLNPFCDPDDTACPFNPRFDDIYYVESDKAKRKYWQTWVACPPIQIKPKKICCFAKAKPAPIKRRKPSAKPSVAVCEAPDAISIFLRVPTSQARCPATEGVQLSGETAAL
uniref:AT31672p n=1 Tax=Drosophila melanogaster TaxID=7227 RepID=Q8T8R9_DROME|nr:AT31672p [Drosophila melanogaster]